jgi:hypothetical protein
MSTQELLQPFCAVSDVRYYLNHIFKKGDFLFASNGHVIVRMPDDGTVEIHPETLNNTIDTDKVLCLEWPADGFIPFDFSAPDVIEKCHTCNATGRTFQKEDCDECDGEGEFKHESHYYECKQCDGSGQIRAAYGEKCTCEDCKGTGIQYAYLTIPDGRQFNYQYILKLESLPGVVYLPDHSDTDYGSAPMRFKFDGGMGLLMPVRK